MLLVLPAHRSLAPYVTGYWFVEDIPGVHAGQPIRTSPFAGAALSFNFGRPNAMVNGPLVPRVSLLGIQSKARRWRSWSQTYFVMAMLTVSGLVRLFPATGQTTHDHLIDLGSVIGDRAVGLAQADASAALEPYRVKDALDRWLRRRLEHTRAPSELSRLSHAHARLRAGARVDDAAAAIGRSRRQLARWCRMHLGVNPKQLSDLERIQASLKAVQREQGDPIGGYCDQAHHIRAWRRCLGITPGAYRREAPSVLVDRSAVTRSDAPAFYL